ncbi:phosphoadenosine phosphosulfate reductase family protein [Desulfovibrio mangrovi]|uniref:phosphoadenosine phosphosulfate reductase family protein n=1 Tax=Desulfovibrio mangrovi TaxID=2976983 RepID=UPI0022460B99|nr:phosphoadenosine phosphosulfate reductase family protein [Desulfovibrio mangrovi]UZP68517.1 phosphoadenosine phosphosulfate reductase family protein [Desulfovibrio mangrovi]
MTLQEKVRQAKDLLEETALEFGPESVAVAWTGGKDSTVLLHLWRQVMGDMGLTHVRALNLDTGVKFVEVMGFRDQIASSWDIDLTIARPEVDMDTFPVAQDKVSCCAALKVEPLARAVGEMGVEALLTGIRRDEHPDRDRPYSERREKPDCLMVHPLLDFTEVDVWAYIMQEQLPYCTLYTEGYRSLGCVPCTHKVLEGDERAGRDPEKESKLDTLRSLGYF